MQLKPLKISEIATIHAKSPLQTPSLVLQDGRALTIFTRSYKVVTSCAMRLLVKNLVIFVTSLISNL